MNIDDAVDRILGNLGLFLSDIDTDKVDKIYDFLNDLQEGCFEEGHALGYSEGRAEGYSEGHAEGYDEGYSEGYDVGEICGYENGRSEGYQEGYDSGHCAGRRDDL